MINIQAVQKPVDREDGRLSVHSIFPTIQGEGPFVGTPCVFVRLAGCNLQCNGCDTDYTSNVNLMTVAMILKQIKQVRNITPESLVIITGGEPFRQNIGSLVNTLLKIGFKVQIETNGTLFNSYVDFDNPNLTIVCSPKTPSINARMFLHIDVLKYVVKYQNVGNDGLPNMVLDLPNSSVVFRPPKEFEGLIYIQPMDEQDPVKNKLNLEQAIWSCINFGYRLGIQMHKIIGVE